MGHSVHKRETKKKNREKQKQSKRRRFENENISNNFPYSRNIMKLEFLNCLSFLTELLQLLKRYRIETETLES